MGTTTPSFGSGNRRFAGAVPLGLPRRSSEEMGPKQRMLLQVSLKKGCIVPKHSHYNEQMTCTLKGSLRVWIGETGEDETRVGAGDVLYVPANVAHKVEVLEDTLNVEVFSPLRQDLLPQQHRAHGQSEA